MSKLSASMKKQAVWWRRTADVDWRTAKSLNQLKRYNMALFMAHLAIEKQIKASIVEKTGRPAPYEHNLNRLAERAGIERDEDQKRVMTEITSFNVLGRYQTERV